MKIAFFISDHGFGHIMRNVAVIKAVKELGHEVVLVTGNRQMAMARQSLAQPVRDIVCTTDAGPVCGGHRALGAGGGKGGWNTLHSDGKLHLA